MLSKDHGYDEEMLRGMELVEIIEEEIRVQFKEYIGEYEDSLGNRSQRRYFEIFVEGLLSNFDRKSIEPIALEHLGEKEVRGFQQFFGRSQLADDKLLANYQELLAKTISVPEGFVCVDGSDFVKKGSHSAGVARQHCVRLGKTENCQAGVFLSYASKKGYRLIDRQLYIPKAWFTPEQEAMRKRCRFPDERQFQTKNLLAAEMIQDIHMKN